MNLDAVCRYIAMTESNCEDCNESPYYIWNQVRRILNNDFAWKIFSTMVVIMSFFIFLFWKKSGLSAVNLLLGFLPIAILLVSRLCVCYVDRSNSPMILSMYEDVLRIKYLFGRKAYRLILSDDGLKDFEKEILEHLHESAGKMEILRLSGNMNVDYYIEKARFTEMWDLAMRFVDIKSHSDAFRTAFEGEAKLPDGFCTA